MAPGDGLTSTCPLFGDNACGYVSLAVVLFILHRLLNTDSSLCTVSTPMGTETHTSVST